MSEHCISVSNADTRRHLRSAAAHFYKLEAPPPLPATIRRRAADALSVTKFFFCRSNGYLEY